VAVTKHKQNLNEDRNTAERKPYYFGVRVVSVRGIMIVLRQVVTAQALADPLQCRALVEGMSQHI
jgi:hypothetical protein